MKYHTFLEIGKTQKFIDNMVLEEVIMNSLLLFLFFIFGVRFGRNLEKLKKDDKED